MNRRPARISLIRAMVVRDLREFSRDRLWVILVPISLAAFILIFWILPGSVVESVRIGVSPPTFARALSGMSGGSEPVSMTSSAGLDVRSFAGESDLAAAVSGVGGADGGDGVAVGIAFPDNFLTAVAAGEHAVVSVYLGEAVPGGLRRAVISAIREMSYAVRAAALGRHPLAALPITLPDLNTVVLGEDRAGGQVPLRDKLRPLMAVLILMIEGIALAGLVAVEIEHRTVTAVLVTPARTGDVLAAKVITGMIMALSQGLFFLALTRSLEDHWLIVLVLMLLGSLMVSAVGMIAGAAGRDFMGTLFFGMMFIIPLIIPAFAIVFPGGAALWVRALPSFGFIQAMVNTIGYGRGWGEAAPHIAGTMAWTAALFGTGVIILKRRVESL